MQAVTSMTSTATLHHDVGRRAIGWLQRSLDCFDPFTYPAHDRMGRLAARKALVELSGLLLYRKRATVLPVGEVDGATDDPYAAMVARLASIAARRPYRDLIARQHRSLWMYGIPYAALRAWGRDDVELRWMVEQAVAARYPVTWERLPFRYLDYLRFLEAGAIPHALASAGAVFPLTLLYAEPNVAELEEDDVYAITHAVFYMTDCGLELDPWPERFDRDSATELILVLLQQFAAANHTDLAAELLICASSLGLGECAAVESGWRLLSASQSTDGAIAAPEHLIGGAYSGERDDPLYREWKRCYHTTLMAALASLCADRAALAVDTARRSEPQQAMRLEARQSSSRVAQGLRRALTWLGEQAQRQTGWPALLAAAGAAVATRAATPSTAASTIHATEHALLWVTSGARVIDADQGRAAADLLALLAATLRLQPRPPSALGDLLALTPGFDGDAADCSAAMDGASVLELFRAATDGVAQRPEQASWSVNAVRAFRAYRLGDAAAIVTALILAGHAKDRVVRDVLEALLAQQRVEGSFGYAALDIEDDAVATIRVIWTARAVCALAAYLEPERARQLFATATGVNSG